MDETGEARVIEASGWYARILQHEIDHLAGTMYVDHMYARTLMTVENFTRHWKGKTLAELKKELLAADLRR
jgi:peptide deformylase